MIAYVTIGGAIDGDKSGDFYDAFFDPIGSERKLAGGGWIGYGKKGPGKTMMDCDTAICPPFDGKAARAGNGIMVAYAAPSPEAVKAAHDSGMKNGALTKERRAFVHRVRNPDFTQRICAIRPATSCVCFAWCNEQPLEPRDRMA